MGVFNKNDQQSVSASETTIISTGARVEGVFNCSSRLHIDGEISGQIKSKSIVTIGKQGKVFGEIEADKLIVSGLLEGDANCDSVEILAGGTFKGKVTSKELMIEAKAKFEGESRIKTDKAENDVVDKNLLKGKN